MAGRDPMIESDSGIEFNVTESHVAYAFAIVRSIVTAYKFLPLLADTRAHTRVRDTVPLVIERGNSPRRGD